MNKKWLCLYLLLNSFSALGQNPIGLPNIVSFARSDYNAGLQNRSMAQDKNGILYFANSEGLLSFDGTYWKIHPLPNKTIVWSIAIDDNGKIFVGGQNEVGYFSTDRNGNLFFTSLKKLIQEKSAAFKNIWDIQCHDHRLFFRSEDNIIQFDGKSIISYRAKSQWSFLGLCGNQLIAQDAQKGLFQFSRGEWSPMTTDASILQNMSVTGTVPIGRDSILVTTLKKGLFIVTNKKVSVFKTRGSNPFLGQLIMCALKIDKDHIAVGTNTQGVYIIDSDGVIIQNLSRKEGLQDNTVLGLFSDRSHNIWIGLDNGIDFSTYNNAIKHIYPEKLNEGVGYSSILFNSTLYIGTSNGLYELPVNNAIDLSTVKGTFKAVEGTTGPAHGFFQINNNLLLAHHVGAFHIKGSHAIPINTNIGFWNFTPYDKVLPTSTVIAGNYNGLELLKYRNNSFSDAGSIKFDKSSTYVIVQNHTAWTAHPYDGIYKIDLRSPSSPEVKLYDHQNGLPSSLKNRLFNIKNMMVVATEKGVYQYNSNTDAFEVSAYFKNIFQQKDIRFLKEDDSGNVWFIEGKKLGVVDYSSSSPRLIYFPELDGKLAADFENIYPLNDENIFVGAEKGFYHINYDQYKKNKTEINVLVSMVRATGDADSILNGGYYSAGEQLVHLLRSTQNSLHFEYSAPSFQKQSNIEYSYKLMNFDKNWSAWSRKTEKDYTNLPDGAFTFQIKARSNLGDESLVTNYTFIILPPWYWTAYAYVLYGILFIGFNYLFYKWLKRKFMSLKLRHVDEQKRLKYLHQLEIEKSEKEIIALKNEKLESEILGKNSELASVAMHLLQKGELLAKIREELVRLRKATDETPSEELKKLVRILNQESKVDKEWEQFAEYFDNTHADFLKAVKKTHPSLSSHELKLCAYLRMNLSSKEMAQLMNITVRGVEVSRYRLRKKLHVPTETSLHIYFTEFSTNNAITNP